MQKRAGRASPLTGLRMHDSHNLMAEEKQIFNCFFNYFGLANKITAFDPATMCYSHIGPPGPRECDYTEVRLHSLPSAKHGGVLKEGPQMLGDEFIMIAREEAFANAHMALKGAALDYHLKHARPKAASPDQALQMMSFRFHSRDRIQRALSLRNALTLGNFRSEGRVGREALHKLMEQAMDAKAQLVERCQNDSLLRDLLM